VVEKHASLEAVVALAKQLSPRDKVRLIELLAPSIERDLSAVKSGPRRSLFGLSSDLGSAPSVEEIDEARRQEWADFPREEI
jgi:hypothetical protein